ncbi:MAG: hypothetical protein J6X03_05250, partial [Bacilli bacterium]|nr:hypothetical protein [Bacilli bacterium]
MKNYADLMKEAIEKLPEETKRDLANQVCHEIDKEFAKEINEQLNKNSVGTGCYLDEATVNRFKEIVNSNSMYQMIADENELRWFFDHVIQRPLVNESYSAVFVSRHKKLTDEEAKQIGLTRKEGEFLSTVTFK